MRKLRNLGLAAIISTSLIGNINSKIEAGQNYSQYNQSCLNFNNYNPPEFRTGYDPNESKPKATDSLPDLSGGIALGVLTVGFLALLAAGFRSNNKEYRKDTNQD